MARNKKNESAGRFAPALTAVALCALFVTLGIGYVWYKNQIDLLDHQIKEREQHLAELQRQNKTRREQLSLLCSPLSLEKSVKQLNLGLGPPALSQVIRLVEIPEMEPANQATADQRQALADTGGRKN
jgi:cell division protein FtsB